MVRRDDMELDLARPAGPGLQESQETPSIGLDDLPLQGCVEDDQAEHCVGKPEMEAAAHFYHRLVFWKQIRQHQAEKFHVVGFV